MTAPPRLNGVAAAVNEALSPRPDLRPAPPPRLDGAYFSARLHPQAGPSARVPILYLLRLDVRTSLAHGKQLELVIAQGMPARELEQLLRGAADAVAKTCGDCEVEARLLNAAAQRGPAGAAGNADRQDSDPTT